MPHSAHYRPWLDVSFPLLPKRFCIDEFTRKNKYRSILLSFKVTLVLQRSAWLKFALLVSLFSIDRLRYLADLGLCVCGHVLACAQGTLWPENLGTLSFDVRRHTATLHNGKDIVIVPSSSKKHDYEDLMAQSTFCLVQRGGKEALFVLHYDCNAVEAQLPSRLLHFVQAVCIPTGLWKSSVLVASPWCCLMTGSHRFPSSSPSATTAS